MTEKSSEDYSNFLKGGEEPAHSRLGASSMSRWSKCPGSVRLSENVEKKSSVYADEGSNAHALAAHCLKNNQYPSVFIDDTVEMEDRKFKVSKDMAQAVSVYIDSVQEKLKTATTALVEHRFSLENIHGGCFGTADLVLWFEKDKKLEVWDYKHGAGIPVSPIENPQLKYYGLGALLSLRLPASTVTLNICQPRCGNPEDAVKEWETTPLDLVEFATDLKSYALATEKSDAPLIPGSHCHFCPAKGTCPALRKNSLEVAKKEFSATGYNPEDLAYALGMRGAVKAWLKGVDEFAYGEALAGRPPPGYKLVLKQARRKFVNQSGAAYAIKKIFPLNDDQIYEPKELKSPAQLEKLIGKSNWKDLMNKDFGGSSFSSRFIEAKPSGLVLAPASDARPEVNSTTAAEEFANILTLSTDGTDD